MSRRDTIIIAVLVNIGLLAILFMLALQTNKKEEESIITNKIVTTEKSAEPVESVHEFTFTPQARDELDQVLNNYPLISSTPIPISSEESQATENISSIGTLPSPKKEASSNDKDYVEVNVKRGDYLEKIARANGTTIETIMRVNRLSSERIDVGQVLKIPLSKKKTVDTAQPQKKVTPKEPQVVSNDPQYYTLKSGDNPWKIAKEFRVRFDDLLKLNNLDEEKARGLKPGDSLRVK